MKKIRRKLWLTLGNRWVDEWGRLGEQFLHFPKGTDREEVWRWFEEAFPGFSVGEKLAGHPQFEQTDEVKEKARQRKEKAALEKREEIRRWLSQETPKMVRAYDQQIAALKLAAEEACVNLRHQATQAMRLWERAWDEQAAQEQAKGGEAPKEEGAGQKKKRIALQRETELVALWKELDRVTFGKTTQEQHLAWEEVKRKMKAVERRALDELEEVEQQGKAPKERYAEKKQLDTQEDAPENSGSAAAQTREMDATTGVVAAYLFTDEDRRKAFERILHGGQVYGQGRD